MIFRVNVSPENAAALMAALEQAHGEDLGLVR